MVAFATDKMIHKFTHLYREPQNIRDTNVITLKNSFQSISDFKYFNIMIVLILFLKCKSELFQHNN